MDDNLSKLATVLIVLFSICFVALVTQLIYVLWHRRKFSSGEPDLAGEDSSFMPAGSKELLLYFFCWKQHQSSRIEPKEASQPVNDGREVDEAIRWQGLYGQSRVLFTISEEVERESLDQTDKKCCSEERDKGKNIRVCLESEMCVVVVHGDEDMTPFATPCASPPYCTPSSSPTRGPSAQEKNVSG